MTGDNFSKVEKYKLYRNVYEILHPTISKKNISNYKIVIDEELVPLLVFYPKRVSNLNSVIIFIPGDGDVSGCRYEYSKICKDISKECDKLVVALDYFEIENKFPQVLDKCEKTVLYLLNEFEKCGILSENITLMGDSTGANLIGAMTLRNHNASGSKFCREVLLYPVLSGEYFGKSQYQSIARNSGVDLLTVKRLNIFFRNYLSSKKDLKNASVCPLNGKFYAGYPETLVVTGSLDPLCDEGEEFVKRVVAAGGSCFHKTIKFAPHGFLLTNDMEMKTEFYQSLNQFINEI